MDDRAILKAGFQHPLFVSAVSIPSIAQSPAVSVCLASLGVTTSAYSNSIVENGPSLPVEDDAPVRITYFGKYGIVHGKLLILAREDLEIQQLDQDHQENAAENDLYYSTTRLVEKGHKSLSQHHLPVSIQPDQDEQHG